ncbi:MAG: right-handed parallel beta-helix repeat-containing protein [Aliarcobacter sp.]
MKIKIMIMALLLLAGIGSAVNYLPASTMEPGANITFDGGNLINAIHDWPVASSSVVYRLGTSVCAKSSNGTSIYTGEDDAAGIQAAFNHSDHTKITIIGDYDVDVGLVVADNTAVELYGSITKTNGDAFSLITMGNDTEWHGGELTGYSTLYSIYAESKSNILIEDVTCHNNSLHGIYISNCTAVTISECVSHTNTKANVCIYNSTRVKVSGGKYYDNIDDYGIYFEDVTYSSIVGTVCYNNGRDGIQLKGACTDIIIAGNEIYDHPVDGIGCHARYANVPQMSERLLVSNNNINNCSANGIETVDASNSSITGNTISNCGVGLKFGPWGNSQNAVTNLHYTGNTIINCGAGVGVTASTSLMSNIFFDDTKFINISTSKPIFTFPLGVPATYIYITNCYLGGGSYGIYISGDSYIYIKGNTITGSANDAIYTTNSDYIYTLYNNVYGNITSNGAHSVTQDNVGVDI